MKRWLVMVEPKQYEWFTQTSKKLGTRKQILLRHCLDITMQTPLATLRSALVMDSTTKALKKLRRQKEALAAQEAKLEASLKEFNSGDYLTTPPAFSKVTPLVNS